jgi:hypothetical protein
VESNDIAAILFIITGVVGLAYFVVADGTLRSNLFEGLTGLSFILVGRLVYQKE